MQGWPWAPARGNQDRPHAICRVPWRDVGRQGRRAQPTEEKAENNVAKEFTSTGVPGFRGDF